MIEKNAILFIFNFVVYDTLHSPVDLLAFLSFSLSLPFSLSLSLTLTLSLCHSLSLSLPVTHSLSLPLYVCVSLHLYQHLWYDHHMLIGAAFNITMSNLLHFILSLHLFSPSIFLFLASHQNLPTLI